MKNYLHKVLTAVFLLLIPFINFAQAPTLGTTADFVLFTSSGALTNTGASQLTLLTGDVGSNYTDIQTNLGNIDGSFYTTGDGVTAQAAADLVDLYNELYGLSQDYALATLLGGPDHFPPGVYANNAVTSLDGNLILDADGDPDALFIFVIKAPGTFSSTANSSIELIDSAQACNVFWLVEGTVGIATGNTMKGTFVSAAAISFAAETEFEGRALTKVGAITINNNQQSFLAQKPIGCGSPVLTGPAAPNLGTAGDFALFTGNGSMANSGVSTIVGDVGSNTAAPTGFDEPTTVDGTVYAPNSVTIAANTDLGNAYDDLNTLSHDIKLIEPTLFGHGLILTPQTYLLDAATTLTGDLYLDALGNPDAVFAIKVNGAFNTIVDSKVLLINGAKAENVYWHVVGAVTIEGGNFFEGTIISTGAVDIKVATELNGRALTKTGGFNIVAITAISVIHTWDGVGPWNTALSWSTDDLPGPNAHVLVNTGDLQIDQDVTVGKMTVNSDALLTIESVGTLTVNGTLTNNAGTTGLILKSDATGTASLKHNTANVSASFERYLNNTDWTEWQDGWHFISSPVAAQPISPNFTVDPASEYDFYAWYELSNLWVNFKNNTQPPTWSTANTLNNGLSNNSSNFLPGKGYMVAYKSSDVKVSSGHLNVADITVQDLTLTGTTNLNRSWHLLGNPFSSALTWDAGTEWNFTNIAGVAKIWNEALQAYSDLTSSPPTSIPATNGFMVQVSSGTGSLTLPAAKRDHSAQAFYKSTISPRIMLIASPQDKSSGQQSAVYFNPEATENFDLAFDSDFLPGYAPSFYSIAGENKLSTNTLPELSPGLSIPFGFVKAEDDSYVIELTENDDGYQVFLSDLKTNTIHSLSAEPTYLFTSDINDDPNRFELFFSPVGIEENPEIAKLNVYVITNQLYAHISSENTLLSIYDLRGRLLKSIRIGSAGLFTEEVNLPSGVYVVQLVDENYVQSAKILVQ